MYGDYDGLDDVPQFDIHLGVNKWDTIQVSDASTYTFTEIIIPSAYFVDVCLINTGSGTPFISSLELRVFKTSIYKPRSQTHLLVLYGRYDLGSQTNQSVR